MFLGDYHTASHLVGLLTWIGYCYPHTRYTAAPSWNPVVIWIIQTWSFNIMAGFIITGQLHQVFFATTIRKLSLILFFPSLLGLGWFEEFTSIQKYFSHIATWKQETPNLGNGSGETQAQTPAPLLCKPNADHIIIAPLLHKEIYQITISFYLFYVRLSDFSANQWQNSGPVSKFVVKPNTHARW